MTSTTCRKVTAVSYSSITSAARAMFGPQAFRVVKAHRVSRLLAPGELLLEHDLALPGDRAQVAV
jgi:hypothetical protein